MILVFLSLGKRDGDENAPYMVALSVMEPRSGAGTLIHMVLDRPCLVRH